MKVGQMPLVIQFNKRDMPDMRSDAELVELARRGKEPVFPGGRHRRQGRARDLHGPLAPDLQLARRASTSSRRNSASRDESLLADVAQKLGSKVPADQLLRRAWVGRSTCSQLTRVARDRRRRFGAGAIITSQGLTLGSRHTPARSRRPRRAARAGADHSTLSSASRCASSPPTARSSRSR